MHKREPNCVSYFCQSPWRSCCRMRAIQMQAISDHCGGLEHHLRKRVAAMNATVPSCHVPYRRTAAPERRMGTGELDSA